jgi:undecaprenyl-diphosphatase
VNLPLYQAVVLGIVQGLTEFLPVSSSGHLILVPYLAGWEIVGSAAQSKAFAVAVHAGTFVGLLIYFWPQVLKLLRAWFASIRELRIASELDRRLAWFIIVSTVPGALAGALGEGYIEKKLGMPVQVALLLAGFGLVMAAAERWGSKRRGLENLGFLDAVVIGAAQALALMPGVSRSGVVIAAALVLGFGRRDSARYAFLISLPIIFGAAAWEGAKLVHGGLSPEMAWSFGAGLLTSAIFGYFAVRFLIAYLARHTLYPFVFYRLVVGGACLAIIASGLR